MQGLTSHKTPYHDALRRKEGLGMPSRKHRFPATRTAALVLVLALGVFAPGSHTYCGQSQGEGKSGPMVIALGGFLDTYLKRIVGRFKKEGLPEVIYRKYTVDAPDLIRLIERENGFRRGVVMIGHSYGATTAVAMCNLLKRRIDKGMMEPVTVKLLVTIDGVDFWRSTDVNVIPEVVETNLNFWQDQRPPMGEKNRAKNPKKTVVENTFANWKGVDHVSLGDPLVKDTWVHVFQPVIERLRAMMETPPAQPESGKPSGEAGPPSSETE
ncbi:MAG: hypothetical protein HY318_17875 [Armatimonadetes bacterium]|nr:hypothetical protein [Armatimonadota bacterium]